MIMLGVLVVAALVAGAVLLTSGDDDQSGELAGSSIRLEPLDSSQDDDFAGNLDLEPVGESTEVALGEVPVPDERVSTGLSGQVATGTEPGLYGGSQDTEVCDVAALLDFLSDDENRDKAEAWAEVQGTTVEGIADYVATLTPMRLRFDTRVTNHGFDGGPTAFQSVLQAGTAVLVDDTGVPRVKCNCGNPLLPPEPVRGASESEALDLENLAENPDDAWESLDPASVVTVEAGEEPLVDFTLLALEDGVIFLRPVGSDGTEDEPADNVGDLCLELGGSPTCDEPELGTGDVQVTLRWSSAADVDLHVTDPGGEEISYSTTTSSSGGQLDVDANGGCGSTTTTPVENIFWPEGTAPEGEYQVEVVGFSDCDAGDADYTLTIRVGGEVVLEESGTIAEGGSNPYSFEA
jgi:hypothetical protein